MKNFFEYSISNRKKLCRFCGQKIEANEKCVAIKELLLPSRYFDLFFHQKCFWDSIKDLENKEMRQ